MPIYDFECPAHGEFEASVTFANADKPVPCPTGVGGTCKARGHKSSKTHQHTQYLCEKPSVRVQRLYAPGIIWADGMTQHSAVVDSENTKKYGFTK